MSRTRGMGPERCSHQNHGNNNNNTQQLNSNIEKENPKIIVTAALTCGPTHQRSLTTRDRKKKERKEKKKRKKEREGRDGKPLKQKKEIVEDVKQNNRLVGGRSRRARRIEEEGVKKNRKRRQGNS